MNPYLLLVQIKVFTAIASTTHRIVYAKRNEQWQHNGEWKCEFHLNSPEKPFGKIIVEISSNFVFFILCWIAAGHPVIDLIIISSLGMNRLKILICGMTCNIFPFKFYFSSVARAKRQIWMQAKYKTNFLFTCAWEMYHLCDQLHHIQTLDNWLDRISLLSQPQWPLYAVQLCHHFRECAIYCDWQSDNRTHCWFRDKKKKKKKKDNEKLLPTKKNKFKWHDNTFDAIKIYQLNDPIHHNQVLDICQKKINKFESFHCHSIKSSW